MLNGPNRGVGVRAVVMVLRGRLRQYWKSWLALSVLVAVAGGFVLAAAVAAQPDRGRLPGFAARHGYDVLVYSGQPLPQLARLPHVVRGDAGARAVRRRWRCASCRKPIDTEHTSWSTRCRRGSCPGW